MVKLEISLKRVQTFIFDVPRLKAMLGANALIGEVMRSKLTALLGNTGKSLKWPENCPCDEPDDPLSSIDAAADRDDPRALFEKGILARDGGRFIAVFDSMVDAGTFREHAEKTLARMLPGVLFDIEIRDALNDGGNPGASHSRQSSESYVLDLPVLQVCQETGREPAAREVPDQPKDDRGNPRYRAQSVAYREQWGDRFYSGKTRDIIGLLREKLYPEGSGTPPVDLSDLASNGYLALVHADGNGIGRRYKAWKEKAPESNDLAIREAHGESFFHSMRVAVRQALIRALTVFMPPASKDGKRGYEILMLGGDDLLLICRADRAIDFAVSYAAELQKCPLADGVVLDVAMGVAIAKKSYPLHRLHELAEALASSAKRLYRSQLPESKASVIDWQVVTQSWYEGIAESRRGAESISYRTGNGASETLLLTGRPYPISGEAGLLGLRDAAKSVYAQDGDNARTPLRALRKACERGRLSGELAFSRLPEGQREQLGWGANGSLWKEREVGGQRFWITRALDIVGIGEIGRLGRRQG